MLAFTEHGIESESTCGSLEWGAERSAVILPWPDGLISQPFGLHLMLAGSSDLEMES